MSKYPGRWLGFPGGGVLGESVKYFSNNEVAGLKSLVRQSKSNSVYRSAAALAALIQLSTARTVLDAEAFATLSCLYNAVTSTEGIYPSESLAELLDDSQPKKAILRVLVGLARDRNYFALKNVTECEPYGPSPSWRPRLLVILGSYRTSEHKIPFVVIAEACHLYAEIESFLFHHACRATSHIDRSAERDVIETAYLTSIFLMRAITAPHVASSNALSQLERLLLSTIVCYVDAIMESILKMTYEILMRTGLLEYSALLFSPLHAFPGLKAWFPSAHSRSWGNDGFQRRVRHLRFSNGYPSILQAYIQTWIPRSRRLLLSIDDLEREARECRDGLERAVSQCELSDMENIELMEDKLLHTLYQARQARLHENGSMLEFLRARDAPDRSDRAMLEWGSYKRNCQLRHRWGQCLRSNLEWDWDLSACLKRLFRVKKPAVVTAEGTEDMLGVSIGVEGDRPPEGIRLAYVTKTGEIRYKLYRACSFDENGAVSVPPSGLDSELETEASIGPPCTDQEVVELSEENPDDEG